MATNWCGIVIRLSFALFFVSQGDGFVPMGIYDGLSDWHFSSRICRS